MLVERRAAGLQLAVLLLTVLSAAVLCLRGPQRKQAIHNSNPRQ